MVQCFVKYGDLGPILPSVFILCTPRTRPHVTAVTETSRPNDPSHYEQRKSAQTLGKKKFMESLELRLVELHLFRYNRKTNKIFHSTLWHFYKGSKVDKVQFSSIFCPNLKWSVGTNLKQQDLWVHKVTKIHIDTFSLNDMMLRFNDRVF